MSLVSFPKRNYMNGCTPIEKMDALTKELNGPAIYIKRDDLTGLPFGGNKTRKLEYLMADALEKGADTIITCGAVQSNHCRLTLAAAIREGLQCQLVIEERIPNSYDIHANGNNFLFNLMRPEAIHVCPFGQSPVEEMEKLAAKLRNEGRVPYIIPVGGSNEIGDLGYVACAEEIVQQMEQMKLCFDRIFVTSGSAGSHAGLLAGMKLLKKDIIVQGIGINRPYEIQKAAVLELANETLEKMGYEPFLTPEDVFVDCNYIGGGYSVPTEKMRHAVELVARTEAIMLDPTYTGKTMSGLIDMIQKGNIKKGETILFVHTGGTPGLFAHPEIFQN